MSVVMSFQLWKLAKLKIATPGKTKSGKNFLLGAVSNVGVFLNACCLRIDTFMLYQIDIQSIHLIKLPSYVGMNIWGGHVGSFWIWQTSTSQRLSRVLGPQSPVVYLLIAENHSKKNCPVREQRKTEKKSGRSLVKLGVEQQRGEAEGLRSPAAVMRSLLRAGRSRLLFSAFPFILHIFLIPVPTFLRSESYFYKAEKC